MRTDALDRAFSRATVDRDHARYPVAEVHRRRIVDPAIEVAAPLGGPAANHLSSYVRAGTRINPLDMRPFTQVLVILDPSESAQRAAVEAALAAHLAAHPERRATWIATRLDAEAGWNGLAAIEGRLGAPVYLMDDRLSSRFQIERVPSLVYAEDRVFVVEEIPPLVER
jgi:conjugal transfer pilus assembly protein TraW